MWLILSLTALTTLLLPAGQLLQPSKQWGNVLFQRWEKGGTGEEGREKNLMCAFEHAYVIAIWFQLFWPNRSCCISHQLWYKEMDLQKFKTEGEGKKRDERYYRPQGKRVSWPWEVGRSHTARLHYVKLTHNTKGLLWVVACHLWVLTCQEIPSFCQTARLDCYTCAEKVAHVKGKAQLTLYNGFFQNLGIFVTL